MSGIRLGDLPDMGKLVDLAMELLEQSIYSDIKPDKLKFRKLVGNMMLSKNGRVWVIVDDDDEPQGFLLGMVTELFFSRDKYATDIAVYVRKSYRSYVPEMFQQFITWAWSKPRVKEIKLGISSGMDEGGRTGKFYESLGFIDAGGLYIMRTQP